MITDIVLPSLALFCDLPSDTGPCIHSNVFNYFDYIAFTADSET